MREAISIFTASAAAVLLSGCSNNSAKIQRYMIEISLSDCEAEAELGDPIDIGSKIYRLERHGKLLCVYDDTDKLVEAYAAAREENATHLFTSEGREWSVSTQYTFGPYISPGQ